MVKTATIWTFDVWGNEKDGFEINDRSKDAEDIEITEEDLANDAAILNWLKDNGPISHCVKLEDITIDGDDCSIFIEDASNGYPLCSIEISENE